MLKQHKRKPIYQQKNPNINSNINNPTISNPFIYPSNNNNTQIIQQLPVPMNKNKGTFNIANNSSILSSQSQNMNQSFFSQIIQYFSHLNLCLRPQVQSHQLTQFLQQYEVVSLYQDPYYGQCYALQSKQSYHSHNNYKYPSKFTNTTINPQIHPYIHKKQHFSRIQSFRHYLSLSKQRYTRGQYKHRKQILSQIQKYSGSQQNVLSFIIISQIQKQQFLFTKMQIYLAYDFILIDLEKQFQNRIIQGRSFTQSEINIIMKESCNGLVALENTGYRSIRMAYVYFCKVGKEIKVAHPKMFNYITNLETVHKDKNIKGIYLSPEQLNLLQRNQINSTDIYGQFSNSFTFGMVVLSLMCNKYLDQVYDYRTCQVYFPKIKQMLKNLSNTYSQRLIKIVQQLLNPNMSQRLTLRSLLNILQQKYQLTQNVQITLIKDKIQKNLPSQNLGYHPLFEQQQQQPQHKNYLYGMLYPRIGQQAQYYHFNNSLQQQFQANNNNIQFSPIIIANHRYSYPNIRSKYIGDSIIKNHDNNKPIKSGQGLFILPDGQSYLGEWKDNQMNGYGKLYWPNKKIRYEGEFKNGQFHGQGIEYANQQIVQRQNQIDQTFVRMHKGSWIKYQGRFKNDLKQGPGKGYFINGRWIGNFKDNQPNGYGMWEGVDGKVHKGIWEDGYLKENIKPK